MVFLAMWSTIQCKYFKGYKIPVSLQSVKIISAKNEQTLIVIWLNYACNLQNLASVKSKFWQIREIYSTWNTCAVWYAVIWPCQGPFLLSKVLKWHILLFLKLFTFKGAKMAYSSIFEAIHSKMSVVQMLSTCCWFFCFF